MSHYEVKDAEPVAVPNAIGRYMALYQYETEDYWFVNGTLYESADEAYASTVRMMQGARNVQVFFVALPVIRRDLDER